MKILKNFYCWFLWGGHDFWKKEFEVFMWGKHIDADVEKLRVTVAPFIASLLHTQREELRQKIQDRIQEEKNLEVLTGLSIALGLLQEGTGEE